MKENDDSECLVSGALPHGMATSAGDAGTDTLVGAKKYTSPLDREELEFIRQVVMEALAGDDPG